MIILNKEHPLAKGCVMAGTEDAKITRMQYQQLMAIRNLIDAATPFLSDKIVDETDGTIPLMNELERAINEANVQFGLEE